MNIEHTFIVRPYDFEIGNTSVRQWGGYVKWGGLGVCTVRLTGSRLSLLDDLLQGLVHFLKIL